MYYNTTNSIPEKLTAYLKATQTQDDAILTFFRANEQSFTPFEVQELVLPKAPVTSVRRSMTNLTDRGFLVKTDEQRNGLYVRPNYCWRLA